MMKIGHNIRVIRTQQKITQKQLAKYLGITPNYLSMIENDSKKPSLTLLERISRHLNTPLSALFSDLSLSAS